MATNPTTHPDLYRTLVVGGVSSPGTVVISQCDRSEEWEKQKPRGSHGSTTVHKGRNNSGFTATYFLATEEQLDLWDDYIRLIRSTVNGTKPKALPCYHPDVARLGIVDVVLENEGVFQHDGRGGVTVSLKFIEYRPPKPKPVSKADAPKATIDNAANDPNAAAKAELAALLAQARAP